MLRGLRRSTLHTPRWSVRRSKPTAQRGWSSSQDEAIAATSSTQRPASPNHASAVWTGTVTTSLPDRTTIDDVINAIPEQHAQRHTAKHGSQSASLVALLTPSFAKHAFDADLPIRIINQLSEPSDPFKRDLEVITAVVDRLPAPAAGRQDGENYGYEGLAYAFAEKGWTNPSHKSVAALQESVMKPGSLYIDLVDPSSSRTAPKTTYTLQLPLAQTIFSTGLVSTLVHSSYAYNHASQRLEISEQRNLESHTLTAPFKPDKLMFHAPLVPLTMRRKVAHCMGNIIRTVDVAVQEEPGFSQSQPASHELEAAVTAYFKAQNMPPEPVQVWALILPSELEAYTSGPPSAPRSLLELNSEDIASHWQPGTESPHLKGVIDASVASFLAGGARFCKVLSGGGGWGKKAGLLSLDPDVRYSTRELRGDEGWNFNFAFDENGIDYAEEQKKQALGETVREGETVMFFLAPKYSPQTSSPIKPSDLFLSNVSASAAIFGALPSSIDAVPQRSQAEASPEQPVIKYSGGVFGVLSEGGMAITRSSGNLSTESVGRVVKGAGQAPRQDTSPRDTVLQTKFDIPFGRISALQGLWSHENNQDDDKSAKK